MVLDINPRVTKYRQSSLNIALGFYLTMWVAVPDLSFGDKT